MIKFDAEFKSDEIFKVFKNATPKFFRKAGAYIRRIAQNSIKRKNDPDKHSPAGKPPFYHGTAMGGGLNFKQSILFSATKDSVVIGPIANRLGALGALHEFGGNQEIVVFADTESKVEVYNLQGANVFAGNESGELRVPVASGVYAVRVSNGQGTMVKVVAVK